MTAAISLHGISKSYGGKTVLRPVELEIGRGEIFGLLGANGSGKSTLLRILAGVLRPTSGAFTLSGSTGYTAQKFSLYDDLSVEENLVFWGRCQGLAGKQLEKRVEAAIADLDLTAARRQRTGLLSHGWKQRLSLAAAICHEPSILLLDETTAGIDPVGRRDLWGLLAGFAAAGGTVLLATHHTDEAERCDRVGYLRDGEVVVAASPEEWGSGGGRGVAMAREGNEAR